MNKIYNYIFDGLFNPGYVVFRTLPGPDGRNDKEWVDAHKVALFVDESEANDYCRYRNEMTEQYETDSVKAISHPVEGRNALMA